MRSYGEDSEYPEIIRARWAAEQDALLRAIEHQDDEPPSPRYPRDPRLPKTEKVVRIETFGSDEARRVHRRSLIVRRFERETARQMSERRSGLLRRVELVSEEVAILRGLLQGAIDRRDDAVRDAYRQGLKRPVIAEVAGVSTAQINNITNGRFPARRHREPAATPKLPVRDPMPLEQLDELAHALALEDAIQEEVARQEAARELASRQQYGPPGTHRQQTSRGQEPTGPHQQEPAAPDEQASTEYQPKTVPPQEAAQDEPVPGETSPDRPARRKKSRRRNPIVDGGDVAGVVA
ncbi:hypothetical protein [Hamadaea tsunoensis]|uniref:hypothetical protein n=1 Tax=Hamadaea tsunoensis TaxID=53368 RepID=UPI000420312F|nr:hypothetical protein [Hamadaea tsunoensis]